jgi:hypothetical protein
MANPDRKIEFTLANLDGSFTVITGSKNEFILKRIPVYVLEMEDVCYHDGSGLLLPEDPAGLKEGASSGQEQKRVSGVAALSLVFRHFEESPDKKLIIAGHDDTAGKATDSFDISKKRAEGVLHLLTGDRESWIKHAVDSNTFKDCQQIMKFYHHERGWECDPGEIDGAWGQKSEKATRAFFDALVSTGMGINTTSPFYSAVKIPPQKQWPAQIWNRVYDLYEDRMFSVLCGGLWTANDAANARKRLSFADPEHLFVACGESFPIEKIGKDGFRSQKNRRVEFLFFDVKELPKIPIVCPDSTDKVHTHGQCPLLNSAFYKRTYIKPDDINSVLYHLKFEYFDRIRNEWCAVPDGLQIKAFKAGKPHASSCNQKNGLYEVRLTNIPGGKRDDDVHFAFETKDIWVYTQDKDSQPRLVSTFSEVDEKLPKTAITHERLRKKSLAERFRYYDLPEKWDSRNWQCKIDQKAGDFKALSRDITSTTAPMVFCLDDIVLVDEAGKQEIKDKDKGNRQKQLDGNSRISLFFVNKDNLELFSPENCDAPYFSKIPFSRNVIHSPPGKALVIAFANDFYTVSNLRSTEPCDITKGQIIGARAAKRNDSEVHFGEVLDDANNPFGHQLFFARGTGNYELHFFGDADVVTKNGKMINRSFVMIYWSARFESHPTDIVTPNMIKTFATSGMLNAKKRWEDKGYTIEPVSPGVDNKIIQPVFFFETKMADSGGKEKCVVTVSGSDRKDCGWMGNTTSDMYREDYKDRNYLNKGIFLDIDGKRYGTLVVAHEYGHATGKDDEYSYAYGDIAAGSRNAKDGPFSQWYLGMPYNIDQGSMMVTNRAPRMRQFWFFVNWINDRSGHANKLGKFLNGEQFKIVHRYGTKQLNYYLPKAPKDFRNIYAPGDPAYLEQDVNTGAGVVDIALYKIGEDETAYSLMVAGRASAKPWDSICVVFIKIGVQFSYDRLPGGGFRYVHRPDGTQKKWEDRTGPKSTMYSDWYVSCENELIKLKNRFWAEDLGASNHYFRNTIIHFFPVILLDPFTDGTNLQPFTNIDLIVNLNDSAKIGMRVGSVLQVGNNTSLSWIVRYILGHDDGNAAPAMITSIAAVDLQFLQKWLRRKLGSATLSLKGS